MDSKNKSPLCSPLCVDDMSMSNGNYPQPYDYPDSQVKLEPISNFNQNNSGWVDNANHGLIQDDSVSMLTHQPNMAYDGLLSTGFGT